jgi:uncharacterized protein (TIGR02266 family)
LSADLRKHPRFLDHKKVEVEIVDRAAMQQLWIADISKGGMFLETDSPPAHGTQLSISLSTPDGSIELGARVVHVVDEAAAKAFGQPRGVGVAFVDLSKEVRGRIERYVDGLAGDLSGSFKVDRDTEPLEDLLDEAKRITNALNQSDLYGAIGVTPEATPEQIKSVIDELCHRFAHPPADCPPPKAARLAQLGRQLERTGALFANPLRRLHYDFHQGHVRVEQRAAAGQDFDHLRTVWSEVFPERVEKARELAKRALALEHAEKLEECVKYGQEAAQHDPFNQELRRAVAAWEKGERNAVISVAPPEKDDDPSQVMQELLEINKRMSGLDHFQLLGLDSSASAQDVARAYLSRSRRFDPEALRGLVPQSVLAMAHEYHQKMSVAYKTLSDAEKRKQYAAGKAPASSPAAPAAKPAETARTRNEMGIVYLRKGDFEQAREMFQTAMDLAPNTSEYQANFAWGLIMDPQVDRDAVADKARPLLEEAIEKTLGRSADELKRRARYHYYLGRLLRERGEIEEAKDHLRKALGNNPKLAEAATELRLIQMRTRKR